MTAIVPPRRTLCSFCWNEATTQVQDDCDIFPCCAGCADAWAVDPGFTGPASGAEAAQAAAPEDDR